MIAISNESGAVTAVNTYDEYGIPGAGNSGRFQYTGQIWLPELGIEIRMTVWYKFLLAAWALTVIPIALLAYGFSGGHISSFPDTSGFTAGQYVELTLDLVWLLSPLLLAPFGFRWRRKHPR